jgi:hypothetical protein
VSVLNSGDAFRSSVLGVHSHKSYALVTETKTLFTVSGLVLVTALFGNVTTAITVANTVKLIANPTVGTTSDLFAATDIGTTDTPAGDLIGVTGAPGDGPRLGVGAIQLWGSAASLAAGDASCGLVLGAGTVQQVTTGTSPDGVIDWHITYVPIDDGATVVAA